MPPQAKDDDGDSDEIEDNSDYDIDDDSNGQCPFSHAPLFDADRRVRGEIQMKTSTAMTTLRKRKKKKATLKVGIIMGS